MSGERSRFVVSADWVEKNLGAPGFQVVDASWYLPAHNRNGAMEYASGHIPGAVFFDQDVIADTSTGLPHSLPSPSFFAQAVGQLGISADDTIVVYDGPGFFSAPRVWWMFRVMGARRVYVLDGGLDGWKAEGRRLETDLPEPAPVTFEAQFDRAKLTSFDQMSGIADEGDKQIADARPAGRFTGEEPEPRAGMRSGHMPGARSVPAASLSENGRSRISPHSGRSSRMPASISTIPSSPRAARVSRPRWSHSRWKASGIPTIHSMTAPGRNGVRSPTRRS